MRDLYFNPYSVLPKKKQYQESNLIVVVQKNYD